MLEGGGPNNQHEVGGEGGRREIDYTTNAEGDMPCGQRLRGKGGRRMRTMTIVGGEVEYMFLSSSNPILAVEQPPLIVLTQVQKQQSN